jgi:hypothetical protein
MRGRSVKGGGYREHIFPPVVIRDGCLNMLEAGATIIDLQHAIIAHLSIVEITREEAQFLDFELKLKTSMPRGWRFGVDSPLARIEAAQMTLFGNEEFFLPENRYRAPRTDARIPDILSTDAPSDGRERALLEPLNALLRLELHNAVVNIAVNTAQRNPSHEHGHKEQAKKSQQ